MCSIFGALIASANPMTVSRANSIIAHVMDRSRERGRDGWGYHVAENPRRSTGANYERRSVLRNSDWPDNEFFNPFTVILAGHLIGNMRAEPTTEYVEQKREYDQQPYRVGKWTIVHNGTIANDRELRTHALPTSIDSAAIVELLAEKQDFESPVSLTQWFRDCIALLKGSYAILATHDDHRDAVLAASNYRPIWFAVNDVGTFFASARDYFPDDMVPQMVEPYSMWCFSATGRSRIDNVMESKGRALVVCSGGMDSVVAATAMKDAGYDVHLLHYTYGSRAEGPEIKAVQAVAATLGVGLTIVPMNIYDPQDSPLLQADSAIAGGEAGAEFAHEWVPARNLVMLSLTTAMAEAKGYDTIVLGNNLEEAGAYPDNEPEFINRFNDMLPFAVGDGKRVRVVMPVGNLMKHEIVALGEQLGAPMHLTWSCYRAGEVHCGSCGPCFMRKTAYEINKLEDPLQYAKKEI
jgi:7-cyano-7-deazaguanine synthase